MVDFNELLTTINLPRFFTYVYKHKLIHEKHVINYVHQCNDYIEDIIIV